jgi:hypothetical protein
MHGCRVDGAWGEQLDAGAGDVAGVDNRKPKPNPGALGTASTELGKGLGVAHPPIANAEQPLLGEKTLTSSVKAIVFFLCLRNGVACCRLNTFCFGAHTSPPPSQVFFLFLPSSPPSPPQVFKEMGVESLTSFHTQVRLNGKYYGKFAFGEDWDDEPLQVCVCVWVGGWVGWGGVGVGGNVCRLNAWM